MSLFALRGSLLYKIVYGLLTLPGFGFMRTMETLDRLRAEMESQAARDLQGYESKNLYL